MAYQIYKVHLIDGSLIEVAENYYALPRTGFIAAYKKAEDNQVITMGDTIFGVYYIQKSNILYISVGEVKVVD